MPADDLRDRVGRYLRAHHTMTIATQGPPAWTASAVADPPSWGGQFAATPHAAATSHAAATPHAACVFYAVDDRLRLIFLSKPSSVHGLHIGRSALVAATVTEQYDDWGVIQGVQLWGTARLLRGRAKVAGMAVYVRRFPFVADLMARPSLVATMREVAVYRVEPARVAFTDNTTGVFGREVLDLDAR